MTIWTMANQEPCRIIGDRVGMNCATAHWCVMEVLSEIFKIIWTTSSLCGLQHWTHVLVMLKRFRKSMDFQMSVDVSMDHTHQSSYPQMIDKLHKQKGQCFSEPAGSLWSQNVVHCSVCWERWISTWCKSIQSVGHRAESSKKWSVPDNKSFTFLVIRHTRWCSK